jgi:hypothetical protein
MGSKWTEADVKKIMGNKYTPPPEGKNGVLISQGKINTLPSPVFDAFKDPYKNDTERSYASYLEQLRHMKVIKAWHYEPWKINLAPRTDIIPDWLLVYDTHFEIHDTKGHLRPQWWAKFKVCKKLFPYFKYAIVKKIKAEWIVEYV